MNQVRISREGVGSPKLSYYEWILVLLIWKKSRQMVSIMVKVRPRMAKRSCPSQLIAIESFKQMERRMKQDVWHFSIHGHNHNQSDYNLDPKASWDIGVKGSVKTSIDWKGWLHFENNLRIEIRQEKIEALIVWVTCLNKALSRIVSFCASKLSAFKGVSFVYPILASNDPSNIH